MLSAFLWFVVCFLISGMSGVAAKHIKGLSFLFKGIGWITFFAWVYFFVVFVTRAIPSTWNIMKEF